MTIQSEQDLYHYFFKLVKERTGIKLNYQKISLVENRLKKRFNFLSLNSLDDYIIFIMHNPNEINSCIPLLTTHKTEWFREIIHFQWLQKEVLIHHPHTLKIWSAACSSGEELFSILFLCIKNGIPPVGLRLLGTDISEEILAKALSQPSSDGFKKQLNFLEKKMLKKIEDQEIDAYLSHSLKFRKFNLVSNDDLLVGQFDVVFLRNVLIYFDADTIKVVIKNILRSLRPGGHLILGLSEILPQEEFNLVNLGNSIYCYTP